MSDLISRQAAIDALKEQADAMSTWTAERYKQQSRGIRTAINILEDLPSAQPDITDEQAIEHLQKSGWMQSHDKQMYEAGLRERLADDSGSYDALLPSAQPEYTEQDVRDSFNSGYACGMETAQSTIIHCKDCVHYGRADKRRFYRGYDCLDGRIASIVPDKDFCSRAERREVTE